MASRSAGEIETVSWMRHAAQSGEARRIRLESHLSLDEVGSAISAHATTVWKWETGRRRPSAGKVALRYAQLLRKLQREQEAA